MSTGTDIEKLAVSAGMRMTEQRRVIAQVLTQSDDHPDVEEVHRRSVLKDRTVRLFEEAGILTRHDFGDGSARYEPASDDHHDHLIDIQSGQVIEFTNEEIEELQREVARKLGYKLVDHRLELYGVPLEKE